MMAHYDLFKIGEKEVAINGRPKSMTNGNEFMYRSALSFIAPVSSQILKLIVVDISHHLAEKCILDYTAGRKLSQQQHQHHPTSSWDKSQICKLERGSIKLEHPTLFAETSLLLMLDLNAWKSIKPILEQFQFSILELAFMIKNTYPCTSLGFWWQGQVIFLDLHFTTFTSKDILSST